MRQVRQFLVEHRLGLQFLLGLVVFSLIFTLAGAVLQNADLQQAVRDFGYIGILVTAYIAGMNVVAPMPIAAFVPIFTAAGLPLVDVIGFMIIGTILADLTGYLIGYLSRRFVEGKDTPWYHRLKRLMERHRRWVLPAAFLFIAFAPLPNETIIVPLALLGYPFRTLVIPVILGTSLNITLLALGFDGLFAVLT
ncbi:hypothetical protein GVX82_01885 [Patescibacteria group bacterium]|jgi:membrane protein YqaA with SNARE-associated domain|nr:hypothetical protein [Patescibacteria group bacterium]